LLLPDWPAAAADTSPSDEKIGVALSFSALVHGEEQTANLPDDGWCIRYSVTTKTTANENTDDQKGELHNFSS
jgi:hypothetical protein